jgi:hypothetical protein
MIIDVSKWSKGTEKAQKSYAVREMPAPAAPGDREPDPTSRHESCPADGPRSLRQKAGRPTIHSDAGLRTPPVGRAVSEGSVKAFVVHGRGGVDEPDFGGRRQDVALTTYLSRLGHAGTPFPSVECTTASERWIRTSGEVRAEGGQPRCGARQPTDDRLPSDRGGEVGARPTERYPCGG